VRLKSRRGIFPAQIEDCCCQAATNFPGGHQPKRITRWFLVWAHTDLSGSLISWASTCAFPCAESSFPCTLQVYMESLHGHT
jgi:hypothetical protein